MKIPTYPDSYFKNDIIMYIEFENLNEDGYHDFKNEFRGKCCFNIGKLHKNTEEFESTDYEATAVIKIDSDFLWYYGIPQIGTCYISMGGNDVEYKIAKAIPHMDFNGTIHYITFLLN